MLLQLYHLKEKKTVLPTQTALFDHAVLLTKVSILNRVGSILVPRGIFRLIIGCTFIVKIGTICVIKVGVVNACLILNYGGKRHI
jgi:ABC-type phosphate transport system permease subunit